MAQPVQMSVSFVRAGALARLADAGEPAARDILDGAARAVSVSFTEHLRARSASRPTRRTSRHGAWPHSGYWDDAADSVSTRIRGRTAEVTATGPGLRLHYEGGTVRPRSGKALAIPARPEVAGVWPSEYAERRMLALVPGRVPGRAVLARREKGGHLTILWWLVPKAEIPADPSVLPPREELEKAAVRGAKLAIDAMEAAG